MENLTPGLPPEAETVLQEPTIEGHAEPKEDPTAIFKKLHKIMSEVNSIAKDATNTHFKYDYASERIIKETFHKKFVEHGIIFLPSVSDVKIEEDKINGKTLVLPKMMYQFVDIDTGQSVTGSWFGSGEDKGDKGLYKGITGAIKYILTSTFIVPTGSDPENEQEDTSKEKPFLSDQQFAAMKVAIEKGKFDDVKKAIPKYRMKPEHKEVLEGLLEANK